MSISPVYVKLNLMLETSHADRPVFLSSEPVVTEEIPGAITLRGLEVDIETGLITNRPAEVVWGWGANMDFKEAGSGDYFIPISAPGAWVTDRPRSILREDDGGGFVQYKGTGNPHRPNFPPMVNRRSNDSGHDVLWAVGRREVTQVAKVNRLLGELDISCEPIERLTKLTEVPVPTDRDGGCEIRSIIEAYTRPWGYADHVRTRQIAMMRSVLEDRHNRIGLTDEYQIASEYDRLEGFFQEVIRRKLPFRNEIALLIGNPLLLDIVSGSREYSLQSQAENLLWIMHSLGRALRIPGLEKAEMPEYMDIIVDLEILDQDQMDSNQKMMDWRKFKSSWGTRVSESFYRDMQRHYRREGKLQAVNGDEFIRRVISSLDEGSKDKFEQAIVEAQDELIDNHLKALFAGISLSQAMSNKDTSLGHISDIGVAGYSYTGPTRFYDLGDFLQIIVDDESMCIDSCLALAKLGGVKLEETDYLIEKMLIMQKIYQKSVGREFRVPSGTGEIYRDHLRLLADDTAHTIRAGVNEIVNKHTDPERRSIELGLFFRGFSISLLGSLLPEFQILAT